MPSARDSRFQRWYGPLMFALAVTILVGGAVVAFPTLQAASTAGRVGADLGLYLGATRSALAGDGFYSAHQLGGPYSVTDGDILYPPPALALFLPFLVLPAPLFWLIPLGIVGAVVAHHRPRPWAWPLMALGLAYPVTSLKIIHGNPFMWIMAAIALGTVYRWPAVFALLKPTLAPFALIGLRHRSWWTALAVGAVASLALAGLWADYLRVALNARSPSGILYSLDEVPSMLIPVVAWLGRRDRDPPANRQGRPDGQPAALSARRTARAPSS